MTSGVQSPSDPERCGDFVGPVLYPVDTDEDTAPETPSPVPVVKRTVYSRDDWQRATGGQQAILVAETTAVEPDQRTDG
jgi:hypothetical protein